MKKSVYKVPDGKLLKVAVEVEDNKISVAKISGDFFLHPEDKIEALENGLKGTELDEGKLKERIAGLVEGQGIQLFGFGPEDLAKAIMVAVGQDGV